MKKIIIAMFTIGILLLFNGCAELNMECGIDNDYNAFIKYDVKLDTDNLSEEIKTNAQTALSSVANSYSHNLGYELTNNIYTKDEIISFTLKKEIACDSYEQAFNTLKKMLTDSEETPFLNVDMTMASGECENGFSFYADTDIGRIVKTSGYEEFPEKIKETVENGLDKFAGTFSVSLPASEYISGDAYIQLKNNIATCSTEISLDSMTVLELSTRLNVENGKPSSLTISQSIANSKSKITVNTIILIISAIGFIVCIIFIVYTKNKSADYD